MVCYPLSTGETILPLGGCKHVYSCKIVLDALLFILSIHDISLNQHVTPAQTPYHDIMLLSKHSSRDNINMQLTLNLV